MTDLSQLKAQLNAVSAELDAEAQKYAEAKARLDARRTALRRQALAGIHSVLDGYRKQAAEFFSAAAKRLEKVGLEPVPPKPEDVDTIGFEAFCGAAEAHPAAKEAYENAMREAAAPLVAQIQGLQRLGKTAGAEAVALGLVDATAALGLIPYHVRKHQRGYERLTTALISASHGGLSAKDARELAELFRSPEPQRGDHIGTYHGGSEPYQPDPRARLRP